MRALSALLALLLLAACGRGASPEVPVNAEDVMFVQMMVPHHRQGIEIAKVGADRATTPELRTLAAAIATTQQDEVEMMLRWLHSWEQPLTPPTGAHDHHGGMPETDVKRIQALRRSENFEYDLLNLLITHQGDAVRMAADEVAGGANPAAQQWAGQVQESRRSQVEIMTRLLEQ
ncbi:DUF305 domain-containing protein [Nonomuraea phyllanthi]|uniref:DUF305 domain-containing protein n=1 Tax=Nonomuraea phyllanthi TaxID=2219224 RepID=A0A5C4WSG2_9ACTN|nr:DUF305 domain-containing protein [Nonomuraea phyllanthi]KAB8196571.1 DUF305 domain-containing protein [Nonomuraea phyllanthi]QFY13692.1 DUF305 domain-containing protein [Nonomuraea phyllanthi]